MNQETRVEPDVVAQATHANVRFWDEPCGTTRLPHLGFDANERSPASFSAFDRWFFEFYPYLDKYIPFDAVAGRDVLEIGLGFGSVSDRLARAGARLTSLDVAAGPPARWPPSRGASHRPGSRPGNCSRRASLTRPCPISRST